MVEVTISKDLKRVAPETALGIVCARVKVKKKDGELWDEVKATAAKIAGTTSLDSLTDNAEVSALREVYRNLGKDPSRYRGSAEALVRRVLQGKDVYQINTVVDINNLISLSSVRSVGSYTVANLEAPVVFGIGEAGDEYKGIGKETVNIANLPVFKDRNGPFGSPTSDSERAMITTHSKEIMMVIISFTGRTSLARQIEQVKILLEKYCDASDVETAITT